MSTDLSAALERKARTKRHSEAEVASASLCRRAATPLPEHRRAGAETSGQRDYRCALPVATVWLIFFLIVLIGGLAKSVHLSEESKLLALDHLQPR
jgi:hypothetical protein